MKKGADFLNEFNTINFFVDQTKESVCIEFLFINGSNFGPLFKSGKVQFSLSDFLFLQRLLILSHNQHQRLMTVNLWHKPSLLLDRRQFKILRKRHQRHFT